MFRTQVPTHTHFHQLGTVIHCACTPDAPGDTYNPQFPLAAFLIHPQLQRAGNRQGRLG